jgi:hypothetical protein
MGNTKYSREKLGIGESENRSNVTLSSGLKSSDEAVTFQHSCLTSAVMTRGGMVL